MSALHPELKRLFRWSRHAPPTPEQAPYGFATRVLARRAEARTRDERPEIHHWLQACAWGSIAVILCGGALLLTEIRRDRSGFNVLPAYQFVARNLAP
jgi:hypothetical protein